MNLITLDFETYYDKAFSLSKMTTEAYIRDPRFEVIGVAVRVNDADTVWFSGTTKDTGTFLRTFDWGNSALLCQNTMFDAGILAFIFDIHPKVMLDTMCMARAWLGVDVSVSLKSLAQHYGVGEKGTEVLQALGKHRADFSAEELSSYAQYCVNDVELTYDIFNKMMAQGFPKIELKLIDVTLRMFTRPLLHLDVELLATHLENVKKVKAEHIKQVGAMLVSATGNTYSEEDLTDEAIQKLLQSNPKFAQVLESLGVNAPMKTSPATGNLTYAFAKTDEAFKEMLEHDDVRVQAVVSARLGVKTTLEETRTERFMDMALRGRVPLPLKYSGARTHRWSGMDAINMQNIPSRGDTTLKQSFRAPDGYVIVGADLSNIELRMGLWLAGQTDKLKALGEGKDLYKDFASSVFGTPYDEVTKEQRFIGKTSQLSLIYGVGSARLRAAIKTGSGVDIGEAESKRIVSLYRTEYAQVKAAWEHGEDALRNLSVGAHTEYGRNGLIKIHGTEGCLLPSGLYMKYPDLKRVSENGKTNWTYQTRKGKEYLYGAKFFQGIVQSAARCIMGECMLRIDKRYPTLLTVHDADYVLAPETEAQEAVEFVLTQMRKAPKWAPDIPLDAEAGFGKTLADC